MAISVIRRTPQERQPSRSEQFGQAFSKGAEMLAEYGMKKEKENAENEALKKATGGIDFAGIQDPEIRKKMVELSLKGQADKSDATAKLQGNKDIIRGLEKQKGLEEGSLAAFESNPDLAIKALKEPKKTQASQPIDPDQLDKIKKIRNEPGFDRLSPSKRYQRFTDEGVSKENAKAEADIYAEELKTAGDVTKAQQHEREFFHNESKDFDKSLTEQFTAAEKKNRALESQVKLANKLGKWDRVVSAIAGQSKWGNLMKSSTAQEFDSYALPQMEGLRQILGGVLSDSDIRLIMQKVVTSDKTPEANKKIANYLMSENNYIIAKKQIGDELKRKNGGYRPSNYDSQVDQIFKERYGNEIKQEFQDLQSLPDDPKKLSQIGRRIVPPGTPLGQNSIQMYFELANGDPVLATQLAEEDGYDVPK